ncbi:MAG TPA: PilN domain-containing protein, partial [Thermoanaerobaculia bacterium]|nr:PilN domain-containing protein [Thermoanaerobaculia bacterium]
MWQLLAAVAAAGLMAGAGRAEPVSRVIPEEVSRAIPKRVAVDTVYETPHGTILRGHAEVFDGVADLLENLGRNPEVEEPVLRQVTRSERGYEYTVVVPRSKAPDEDALWRGDSGPRQPFFVALPVAMALDRLLFPPFIRSIPVRRHRRSSGAGAEKAPENQDQPAVDEQALAGLSIDEITVAAIYQTSIGGVALARAQGREVLLRDGDRLADGEVDGIDFIGPTVAWVRFRRRIVSTPGVPYRPVVWLLAGGSPEWRRREPGSGLTIGGAGTSEVEAHRLGDEDLGRNGFPPWTWELTIDQAPRLVGEMLESSGAFEVFFDRIRLEPGFGTLDVRLTSRDSPVRAPAPAAGSKRVPDFPIDGIEIAGLFMTPEGPVAEVRTFRGFSFLREGDRLYDGNVERIDQAGVTFKQRVPYPVLRPFCHVVKSADPRWIGTAKTFRKMASEPPASDEKLFGTCWNDEILERDEREGEARWDRRIRRDPFLSLQPGGAPAQDPPSALAQLTCGSLASAEAGTLAGVLERADLRLAGYKWERRLIEKRLDGRGSWARRFLDDVARAASSDLSRLFGELDRPESLKAGAAAPPAEMFALLGDLNLVAGRLPAAAESYGIAEQLSPGQETLCGHLYDGKLYGVESFSSSCWGGTFRWLGLTGYLLAWDLASGRVVERHLLPMMPEALAVQQGELQITLHGGDVVRLAGQRLAVPVPVAADLNTRSQAILSGTLLAQNFAGLERAGSSSPFEVSRYFDDRLPLDLPELEQALRAAALRDPTQPWHPFFLGQALWAQGRREEAETLWRGIWDGGPRAPYYELLQMATFYEGFGQREWADRAFDQALE